MEENVWVLTYPDFQPEQEGLREALCTLGNGYYATRGAAAESVASDINYPGTYLAGGYNRLMTEIAGRAVENEDLVNMPNWLLLRFRPENGDWFNLLQVTVLDYRQELDLKQGILRREVSYRDREGRETLLQSRRIVHMGEKHLGALEMVIRPLNWSGRIQFHSVLDGTVINAGVARYRQLNNKHLEPIDEQAVDPETVALRVRTVQSRLEIAMAGRTRCFCGEAQTDPDRQLVREPGLVGQEFTLDVGENESLRIEKVVSLFTSRDRGICESFNEAVETLVDECGNFAQLLPTHTLAWAHLWERCDIEMKDGGAYSQMVLRLHIFHLLQTVSMNSIDLDIGVPARGWHGEAYRGHIFWDELFILPYLNLNIPELVRSLLMYRFRRLDRSRSAARAEGLQGALFPWQSGSNGREETQELHLNPKSGRWLPDHTHLQRHVNTTIAYNVWQYFEITHDYGFMSYYGAELFLEIARCLASLVTFNPEHNQYEMCGVMGPDEYHDSYPGRKEPGLDNNTYTNVMTAWVLNTALKVLDLFDSRRQTEIKEIIDLRDDEVSRWQEILHQMRIVFHRDGIMTQFEGYEDLAEFDWTGYREKYGDIQRLDRILEAEGDTPNRYKVSKQADVLMLFHLFSAEELRELFTTMGYEFDPNLIPATIDYYLERTSNGSTLSNVVHSWVLSRSDRPRSWHLFNEALMSDVADIQGGTTHEGIHLGAMAGTVDLIQRCYTGIEFRDDVIWLNPRLPDDLTKLKMCIQYRGQWFFLDLNCRSLTISCSNREEGKVRIGINGEVHIIESGRSLTFNL